MHCSDYCTYNGTRVDNLLINKWDPQNSRTYDFVTQLTIIRAEETPKPKDELSKLR